MAWVTKDSTETYNQTPEPPREYTKKEKAANWWHYHWMAVVVAVLVVVFGVWIIKDTVFQTRPDVQVAYVGTSDLPTDTVTALQDALTPFCSDLNGDGTADEVDAQILNDILEGGSYEGKTLESLQSNDVVTVPANGSVQVKATLSLNEEGKQYMEENFSNGNYLEGYVYLNAETDAEGKSRAGAGPETGRRGQTLDLVALGHNDRTSAQKADAVDDLGP